MIKPTTKHKLVICPECKGDRVIPLGGVDEKGTPMDIACDTCKSDGLVRRFVKVWYEPV